MSLRVFFCLLIASFCLGVGIRAAEDIPTREPDIKSKRAKLDEYYTYDQETGKWIWSEDYPKILAQRAERKKWEQARLKALQAEQQAEEQAKQEKLKLEKQEQECQAKIESALAEQKKAIEKAQLEKEKKDNAPGFFGRIWDSIVSFVKRVVGFCKRCYHRFF